MIPSSIRWRLPLSYAAIALLTTLALGLVLLLTLRNFYEQQEQQYLQSNAAAIGSEIVPFLRDGLPVAALESQLKGFAFLSQARVQVLDAAENVVADSGSAALVGADAQVSVQVEVNGVLREFSQSIAEGAGQQQFRSTIVISDGPLSSDTNVEIVGGAVIERQVQVTGGEDMRGLGTVSELPVVGTPFGFGLGGAAGNTEERSGLVVQQPLRSVAGDLLGYVVLSEGPAYGREIVRSVAWGWGVASVVAVLLAAAVGWLVSRRLSGPLVTLTAVTTQMAAGDLTVRTDIVRNDEVGQLAQAFNTMAGQVESTVATLRQFVADAAHELYTPLTALQTDLALLEAKGEPVARAREQAARLQALTTGLLDLSRLEGNATADFAPLDMVALVQRMAEIYASRAEQAGVEFVVEMGGGATGVASTGGASTGVALTGVASKAVIYGHETQLGQAIGNLLDNAIKFTLEGGRVVVTLTEPAGVEPANGKFLRLTVRDSGIGIPAEDMAQLFHRFHRGRNVAAYPGNGLGLAIARAIVEGHGGKIAAMSDGGGTTFTVCLPLYVAERG